MNSRDRLVLSGGALFVVIASMTGIVLYMGILNRLFVSNRESTAPVEANHPVTHQEDWTAYLSTVDNNQVGSILVDLGLKSVAPVATHPDLLRVDVGLKFPSENGLPEQREFPTLNNIDERLSTDLSGKVGAIYAGHLYLGGRMYLFYYLSDKVGFESEVAAAMRSFPEYSYVLEHKKEEGWQTYIEFLYPQPIQLQSIRNRKTIAYLEAQGDKLEKEREVTHWIYFSSPQARELFISRIKDKGFATDSQEQIKAIDGKPFLLRISRVDKLTPAAADDYILDLWKIADDCGGEYDGWETSIVKD